jgi:hypothetical protein
MLILELIVGVNIGILMGRQLRQVIGSQAIVRMEKPGNIPLVSLGSL